MSTLHELRSERLKSSHPVVKVIGNSGESKLLGIALPKNSYLKEHKTDRYSKLMVIEGKVEYIQNNLILVLHAYDEIQIPINEIHSLNAFEDSLCLLYQKNN